MSNAVNRLKDQTVAATLDRLHKAARGDWKPLLKIMPRAILGWLAGRSMMKVVTPAQLRQAFIPVSRGQGQFLYVLARALNAKKIVEFGSSFGISTVYLAAAARDTGGRVTTTEIEPLKCRATEANLKAAGLDRLTSVLEGDALATLKPIPGPIDLVFLDGWKDLYLPVLELLLPKLRTGSVVVADNVNFKDAQPYVRYARDPAHGFASSTLFAGRMEVSVLTG